MALRPAAAVMVGLALSPPAALAGIAGEGIDKHVTASRARVAPTIDGVLSDRAWTEAAPSNGFTQTFPADGAKPTFETSIRIVYDDRALYIGIDARDPEPELIVARLARRDNMIESDHLNIVLDTQHDHDNGYRFWINAAGVLADGQVHDDNRTNQDWDAVWTGRARINDHGWSAELAIPYAVLRFPHAPAHTWGLNVTRFVARTKEIDRWVHVPTTEQGELSRAGHIEGITGLDPPRPLELRPFALVRGEATLAAGGALGFGQQAERDGDIAVGLDAKYGLTGNLTLDATILPDFGQVEADPVVLNLSTFETFFPEKRPFFLENANLFVTDIQQLHSRRIGQRASGYAPGDTLTLDDGRTAQVVDTPLSVPIWGAARVTGKLTPEVSIAALEAVTGPEKLVARAEDGELVDYQPTGARSYSALRGKYSFGGSSYLGFMGTGFFRLGDVDSAAEDRDSITESIDGRWVADDADYRAYFHVGASHRIGGRELVERDPACTLATCTPITRADGTLQAPGDVGFASEMGGGKVGGEHWLLWTNYGVRTKRFDPNAVGFENDWDYHRGHVNVRYREQKPFGVFQNGEIELSGNWQLGTDGLLKEVSTTLDVEGTFRNFWYARLWVGYRPDGTYTTRETSDGARWDRSDWGWAGAELSSDSRRALRLSGHVAGGYSPGVDTWNMSTAGNLDVRVWAPLELTLNASFGMTEGDTRFYSCASDDGRPCSVLSARRDYQFADLDSGTFSLTARSTWALSPEWSLQGYVQLFAARGGYDNYREIAGRDGAKPELDRAELTASALTGDTDGDGVKDDDFGFATLNANLVLRWELRPGATLIAVYTRAQSEAQTWRGTRPTLSFNGLAGGLTHEIVLVKLTYYWAR